MQCSVAALAHDGMPRRIKLIDDASLTKNAFEPNFISYWSSGYPYSKNILESSKALEFFLEALGTIRKMLIQTFETPR